MEVSNASHYDGASAVAEAVVMAYHHFRGTRNRVVVSPSLNPMYREVIRTYTQGYADLVILGDDQPDNLQASPNSLLKLVDSSTCLLIVQYPDFFGRIFDYTQIIKEAHAVGALVAVAVNPIALGLLKTPGEMGADIAVGEGQPLGIPLSFGGPYLGIFTTRKEFVRKISGRLVGETVDHRGNRAYVLTLTAREQHIRRERATSNICTNQGLMALASAVYLSLLGKKGLRQVAELCYHKAHYAARKIAAIPGFKLSFDTPFFNEFSVSCPMPVDELNEALLNLGILGGYNLAIPYPALKDHLLVAVTEKNTRQEIDEFVEVLAEVTHE
jgi:glycine dehydrogenase subunit 1